MAFHSVESMNIVVRRACDNALRSNVRDVVRKSMHGAIVANVHGHNRGVFESYASVKGEVDTGALMLTVFNDAQPDTPYYKKWRPWDPGKAKYGFADMINNGSWVDIKAWADMGFQGKAPRRPKREFFSDAENRLKGNTELIKQIVKKKIMNMAR